MGEVIERREVLHGAVWLSTPVTVVADDGRTLAVRLDPGAAMTFPSHPFGPHPWSGTPRWSGTTVLQLYRPDDWYSVWRLYDERRDLGWYVNFEAPVLRGPGWVATHDYGLDIVVAPDGSWKWKDLGDPDELVRVGRLTQGVVDVLWVKAAAVAADLDDGRRWWADWDGWTVTS